MSNYNAWAMHPETGKPVTVECLDDYFGRHQYGYRFHGETKVHKQGVLQIMDEEHVALFNKQADEIERLKRTTVDEDRYNGVVTILKQRDAEIEQLRTENTDLYDTVLACLKECGGQIEDLDILQSQLDSAGTKPSQFVKRAFRQQAAEIEALRKDMEEQACPGCGRHRPYCDCLQDAQAENKRLRKALENSELEKEAKPQTWEDRFDPDLTEEEWND